MPYLAWEETSNREIMTKMINQRHSQNLELKEMQERVDVTKHLMNSLREQMKRIQEIEERVEQVTRNLVQMNRNLEPLEDSVDLESEMIEASDADSEDWRANTVGTKLDGQVTILPEAEDFDMALINAYLDSESQSLHPRRTLDQAYYHMLNDIEKRDSDQVVDRWAQK